MDQHPARPDTPRLGRLVPDPPWGQPPPHPCGQLASWAHRVFGRVIDTALVFAPAGAVALTIKNRVAFLLVAVILLGALAYCDGRLGRTPGKRALGLRLVREADAHAPGGAVGIAREVAHLLDTWTLLIGWFFPIWDRKRQTFADKVCGTIVVVSR